jgi:hypothetical protein
MEFVFQLLCIVVIAWFLAAEIIIRTQKQKPMATRRKK